MGVPDRASSERSELETQSPEKMDASHKEQGIDAVPTYGLAPDDAEFLNSFTEAQRKRVVRKIDVRRLPLWVLSSN